MPFGFGAFGDDAEAVGPGVDIVEIEDHLQRGGEEGILRGACNIAAIFAVPYPRQTQRVAVVMVFRW